MQDAKYGQNVWALKGMFWLESITRVCFYHVPSDYNHFSSIFSIFSIFLSTFSYFENLKWLFYHQSRDLNLQKEYGSIWSVHFISVNTKVLLIIYIDLWTTFIDHLCFLNLKTYKNISWFQCFNLPPCGFNLDLSLY